MKRDAYNYAKLCVRKYGVMLLPMVYCMLNLLVLTRCSIVVDVEDQHEGIITNKFCTNEAAEWCPPGTHVLCMYNETEFGARCIDAGIVPLEFPEREYIRQIFNGFKRELAKGFTVLGKDNVPLPRANEMHALHWDFTFGRSAQAWANQCNPTSTDLCRNLGTSKHPPSLFMPRVVFKNVGQMVTVFRFNMDWTHPGYKFEQVGGPEPTVEKVRFAIREIARDIYNHRKLVTPEMIRNYTVEQTINPYLFVIYGYSSRFACAMTKYVDYMVGDDVSETHSYNAIMFVCNNGHRPRDGFAVYDTNISNGTCTCTRFHFMDRIDDCLCSDRMDPLDYPIVKPPVKCTKSEGKDLSGRRPAVVLMPIVAVEDGDPNTQSKRVAFEELKQNLELRQKIKDRVEMVRDRYFKNYFVVDPGTRFPNDGPIDNNTFILFRPETKPDLSRKAIGLKSTKRKRHTIKPRKNFSNIDHLVSEYLTHKRQIISHFATDVIPYKDMKKIATATVSPTENYQNSQRLSTRNLRYGVRGTPKQNSKDFVYNKTNNKMVEKNTLRNKDHIPGTYKNFLRPSKHIRKGDLMHIIVPPNIEYEKKINSVQRIKFTPRNQNPLRIHTYDGNNFDYNRPFENRYVNVEYDNRPGMLINLDYDEGLNQNGNDYLDIIAGGDNLRFNRPDVYYGSNKISRSNLDGSNYRRAFKHYNQKLYDQRRREDVAQAHKQRYLIPDRLNHIREL